jgi:phage terminase large subunit-like protein
MDHFLKWAGLLVLDNGQRWTLEPFQQDIVSEVFAGYREILAVLPTGSYKTTTFGGLALYFCQFKPDARVPIGAAAKDQAGIMFDQAGGFVRRSPALRDRFEVRDGTRIIKCPGTGGIIRVYSASDDSGDGIIPDLACLDELHRHKGHDLYGTWRDKLTKRGGTMLIASTAGDDETNPLEELREAAHRLPNIKTGRTPRHTVARSADLGFVMHEYALKPGDDADDLAVVKHANPASQVTLDELRMRRDSPSTKTWQWLRFTCNMRSKGEDSAIAPEVWDGLAQDGLEPDRHAPALAWMDLAWKIDQAAIGALVWESHERRVVADVVTLPPPVDEADIVAAVLRLQLAYGDLRGVVYDPNAGGQQMVQLLEKGEHPLQTDDDARAGKGLPPLAESYVPPLVFVEHSQDNAPMAEAAARFEEAVRNRWIIHDGDRDCSSVLCRCHGLRGHVLNAVAKPLGGEKWRYDRPSDAKGSKRAKYPIDALTGILIGHNIAVEELAMVTGGGFEW